ncbi:hypothetical protein [Cupriavidus malaysiensis]|uniref:Uncharacterized protein n=1 Tax=Cupriavidus malaysiensis TaxID=367825 RepID=A0ABM6F3S6_9BURK|nr:hypothetical protein [Cupriavidus malaysiensis]AOZ05865.1 hypothetical protein BKK80_08575 [Cupriavidus malaysiensis]
MHILQSFVHIEVWIAIFSLALAIVWRATLGVAILSAMHRGERFDDRTLSGQAMSVVGTLWTSIKLGACLYIVTVIPVPALWLNILLALFLLGDTLLGIRKIVGLTHLAGRLVVAKVVPKR